MGVSVYLDLAERMRDYVNLVTPSRMCRRVSHVLPLSVWYVLYPDGHKCVDS